VNQTFTSMTCNITLEIKSILINFPSLHSSKMSNGNKYNKLFLIKFYGITYTSKCLSPLSIVKCHLMSNRINWIILWPVPAAKIPQQHFQQQFCITLAINPVSSKQVKIDTWNQASEMYLIHKIAIKFCSCTQQSYLW